MDQEVRAAERNRELGLEHRLRTGAGVSQYKKFVIKLPNGKYYSASSENGDLGNATFFNSLGNAVGTMRGLSSANGLDYKKADACLVVEVDVVVVQGATFTYPEATKEAERRLLLAEQAKIAKRLEELNHSDFSPEHARLV